MNAEEPKHNESSGLNKYKATLSEKSQILIWVAIIGVVGNILTSLIGIARTHDAADVGKAKVTAEGKVVSERIAGLSVPVRSLAAFGGSADFEYLKKNGWLVCDGSSHSKDGENGIYKHLFDVIGYAWGRGSTDTNEFRVPDLQGYFLRGIDPSGMRDLDSITNRFPLWSGGNTNGVGSYQSEELKEHSHLLYNSGTPGSNYTTAARSDVGNNPTYINGGNIVKSSGGRETRPKNAYVYYIIKFQ